MKRDRILIMRTDRLGDVVLSTPVIKSLRDSYPNAHIAFMVRPYTADVVRGNPYLDEVIVYDKYGAQKGLLATILFALSLARKRFNIAIILHPTNRSHLIAFLSGIPERIGFSRKLPFLLTTALEDKKHLGEKHELEYTLNVLLAAGVERLDRSLFMPLADSAIASVSRRLRELGVGDSEVLIVVHPWASCASKRWPPDRFQTLIQRIHGLYRSRVVLLAGSDEVEDLKEMVGQLGDSIIDMSGCLDVAEMAALLKRATVFISNDSGPVHVASAVGTRSIVIFGRKQSGLNPVRWGPTLPGSVTLHHQTDCGKCRAHNCANGYACLNAISTDMVMAQVKHLGGDLIPLK